MPDGAPSSVQPTTTSTSGAGIADSYAGLVTAITSDAESEGEKVVDISLSAAGVVADTIGFAVDPFGSVVSAGVGWLLEHVSFLREPLDALLGNPDEINANLDTLKSAALEMHTHCRRAGRARRACRAVVVCRAGAGWPLGGLLARARQQARADPPGDRGAGLLSAARPAHLQPTPGWSAQHPPGRLEVDRQGETGDPTDTEDL